MPAEAPPVYEADQSRYDHGARRATKRSGRERGCWTYIPLDELVAAGLGDHEGPIYYRVWGQPRGGVLIRLYRDP